MSQVTDWKSKIKRFNVAGKWYWYRTDDGGISWNKISTRAAMNIIDSMCGVTLA